MPPVLLHNMTPDDLRDTQQRLGLSYRDMAARLGVNRNTYMNWLQGRTRVPSMVGMAVITLLANAEKRPKLTPEK